MVCLLIPYRFNGATQTPSGTFNKLAEQAKKASEANHLDEAARLYARALIVRPRWAEGWWALGTLEYDRDRYSQAAVAFEKLIALQPKNGTANVMLGLCEFELGREQRALSHIQRGKNLGLNNDAALANVVLYHEGVLLQRNGNFQAAQDTLEELCLRGGPPDQVANVLGMTMLRMTEKNPPQPGSPGADVVLGIGRAECLAGQKKYDEARPAFESVVKANPNYPNVHYAYGLFLMEISHVESGVEQFKQEIANDPGHVFARLRIAASLYKRNSADAIPFAEEAVKLAPSMAFAHYLLGLLLLDANESARAIPELELAEKHFTRDPRIYLALASAYSREGRKREAATARATFERLNKQGEKSKTSSGQTERNPSGIPMDTAPQ
jgi:tetratricopeptide (TPR) repeat protein